MCAGTVVDPAGEPSAGMLSITSRSRSVAFRPSLPFSARIRTLARIGIVLRRSTTRCTWPMDLRSAARSTVTFVSAPARSERSRRVAPGRVIRHPMPGIESGAARGFRQGHKGETARLTHTRGPSKRRWPGPGPTTTQLKPADAVRLLLQQPLQELDLFGEHVVVVDQALDLAHRVQHRGVVAPAEAAADLGQRTQRQGLCQI